MTTLIPARDSIHWYMSDLTSRIVAETGIPSDRYHLGKIILQSLKDAPDFVLQVDAKLGKSETCGSVLKRSVQCALSLKKMGLKCGDVMIALGHNHLEMGVLWYAGLYLGIKIAPLDITYGVIELKEMFQVDQPKVIVCQSEYLPKVTEGLKQSGVKSHIVSFDEVNGVKTFSQLLEESAGADINSFKPEDIDPAETISFLTSTSGSTGLPKVVAVTHKNFIICLPLLWSNCTKFPTPVKSTLLISAIQWMTASMQYIMSPILRFTRIQASVPITEELFIEIVNKYKPTYIIISPTLMTTMMKHKKRMDLSCFDCIMLGGSAVPDELIDEVKENVPKTTEVYRGYGMSELSSLAFDFYKQLKGSVGRPFGPCNYRLIDPNTLQDVTEPHVTGELWIKGPTVFKEYYNNPELTKEAFLEEGWLRTGDLFYRDENYNFFFEDRLKSLLKYRNNQVSPAEIEKLIHTHPGVLDVAVTGIPDPEYGDLPVACVVPRPGHSLTAQEIKDLVKDTLSDAKQLRGGVIFMDNLPVTATTKVDRQKLKEIVKNLKRE